MTAHRTLFVRRARRLGFSSVEIDDLWSARLLEGSCEAVQGMLQAKRKSCCMNPLTGGRLKMKLGIVIHSSDPETVWNAFRLGVYALKQGDAVRVFLLAKGVDSEKLDAPPFKVVEQMRALADAGGQILLADLLEAV